MLFLPQLVVIARIHNIKYFYVFCPKYLHRIRTYSHSKTIHHLLSKFAFHLKIIGVKLIVNKWIFKTIELDLKHLVQSFQIYRDIQ